MLGSKMSRDARKMIDELDSFNVQYGKKETSLEDVFVAEELAYSYFAKTICAHIKRYYNSNSDKNPESMSFYVKPTKSINKGRRNKDEWTMTDNDKQIYVTMTKYLIEDFNYDQLKLLREVSNTYNHDTIIEAIKISKSEDVYSIPYVHRVAEGIKARHEIQIHQIQSRRKLFYDTTEQSMAGRRSRIEIASLMHDWQQSIQNVELEKKVKRLYKEEKD